MALISKASLLMVPSTYEQEKLYNVLPSGNRAPDSTDQNSGYDQTRADFTFDRGSNAAATRIGSDGLIKKYRENKLLQSNQFDTTWSGAVTKTSGQSGYDGSTNAWLIQNTAASGYIRQTNATSGVLTASIYAKAGNANWMRFAVSNSPIVSIYFDLVNGIGHGASNLISHDIEDVGNGWRRYSVAFLANSMGGMQWYPADGNNNLGEVGDNIYIQNAQLESSMVATDYLDSGATTGKAGVLIDLPRINYDANGENGSLLLEPSRANVVDYTEYISGHSIILGTNGGTNTITENHTLSPEGVQNAARIQADITDTTDLAEYSLFRLNGNSLLGGVSNSLSFYAKSMTGADQDVLVYWNYDKEIITITNDWQRFTFNINPTNNSSVLIGTRGGDPNEYYVGGDASLDFALWGIQVEQSVSYPTSYIPNHGESGGVTRAADLCTGGGSAESINSTEGVLYWECSALNDDAGTTRVFSISDGSSTNSLYTGYNSISNLIQSQLLVNGVAQTNMTHFVNDRTEFIKVAVLYKNNDHKMYINGEEVETDTSGSVPAANTFDTFNFDLGQGSFDFYGNVKQVAVFNEALSDSELATLTTL